MIGKALVALFAAIPAAALGENPLVDFPDVTGENGLQAMREWAKKLAPFGETQFSGTRMPSPEYWGDLSIYQIFPDRFNNGNSSNDNLNWQIFQKAETSAGTINNVHVYTHGGDIRGMIDRLDYIASLGADIVFPTSFFYNNGGQFHGYCVTNHLMIDPKFGTLKDFQELVKEAHKLGLRVVLDFVINHVCDVNTKYKSPYPGFPSPLHDKCTAGVAALENIASDEEFHRRNREFIDGRGEIDFSDSFFPPLKRQEFFCRCGKGGIPGGYDTFEDSKHADFVEEMFDLHTANPDVHLILTEMAKYWIAAADVDGFRLDAAKHTSDSLLPYFSTHVRDYALSLGKDNFYVIGEVVQGADWQARIAGTMETTDISARTRSTRDAVKSIALQHPKQKFPGCTAVYDFAHSGSTKDTVRGEARPSRIQNTLENDPKRTQLLSQADMGLFFLHVDIHDWPRLLAGKAQRNVPGILMAGYGYVFTARGMPLVYYGSEFGFNGDCYWSSIDLPTAQGVERIQKLCSGDESINDPDALFRQTMWVGGGFALGTADRTLADPLVTINVPKGIQNPYGRSNWRDDPYLQANPISDQVKRLNYIRKSCPALRRGAQWIRWTDQDDRGLVVFSRLFYNQEIVVMINMRGSPRTGLPWVYVDYNTAKASSERQYINLLNPDEVAWVDPAPGGGYKLERPSGAVLPPYGVSIFVRKDYVDQAWCDELKTLSCNGLDPQVLLSGTQQSPKLEETNDASPESSANVAMIAGVGGAVAGVFLAAAATVFYRRKNSRASLPVGSVVVKEDN